MGKELNTDFFKIKSNNVLPEKGKILISEPFSQDLYFKRSIVLLTEYSSDGAMGFILNKPVDIKLNEALDNFPKFDASVSLGGPVNTDRVFFLHTLNEKMLQGSINIYDDIYWAGNFHKLKNYITEGKIDKSKIRFFLGYSGWSAGQLENEIKNNFWLVSDIDKNLLFETNTDIWKEALQTLDEEYKMWLNFPENPIHN
jgi:putative transcriptional regulator